MPGVEEHEIPYFASIAQFDDTVGELIEIVETKSDPANTIFVFVCDNGWSPSTTPQRGREVEFAHTMRSKRAPFDEGVRSPILFRWDGRIEPKRHGGLVSSVDIVPTVLSAIDDSSVSTLPGQNLMSVLSGERVLAPDRAVFGAIYPGDAEDFGNPGNHVAYRFVRKGDFKLIVPHGEKPWGGYVERSVLFNVRTDPAESSDLFGKNEFEQVAADLQAELDNWWKP